jgi:FkbM family methyltransferase
MLREFALRNYGRIMARPSLASVHRFLFDLSLRGLGIMNWENWSVTGEEWFLKHYLPNKLRGSESPTLLDVGANVGRYSSSFLQNFPHGRVFAFEPHPKNFEALTKDLSKQNCTTMNAAVGSRCGEIPLYDYADDRAGSSHASVTSKVITDFHRATAMAITVPVTTLDHYCRQQSITTIELLKIDVEGHELEVLHGAKELIEAGRIQIIQFEFNFLNIYSRSLFSDFESLLDGYRVYRLLPRSMLAISSANLTESHAFAFQNIVAIRDSDTRP